MQLRRRWLDVDQSCLHLGQTEGLLTHRLVGLEGVDDGARQRLAQVERARELAAAAAASRSPAACAYAQPSR